MKTEATSVEIRAGQIWESTDRRTPGRQVKVTYVGIVAADVEAHAPATNDNGSFRAGRRTKIRLSRFRAGSTGWKLVQS